MLRATSRFCHRVVLFIDSKVVLGAISKGRSSSKLLNAIVRRAAALCFAGGLVLHCVFISTKHNPADWPSRGDITTWPAALRRRIKTTRCASRCPGCGDLPSDHPKHLPKRLRGKQASYRNCCIGAGGGFAYDFDTDTWVPYFRLYARHMNAIDNDRDSPRGIWSELATDDTESGLLDPDDERTADQILVEYLDSIGPDVSAP